jgi:hypothetical protein
LVLSGLLIFKVALLVLVPGAAFLQSAQRLLLKTKCDDKSKRHRKHYTSFEQIFTTHNRPDAKNGPWRARPR